MLVREGLPSVREGHLPPPVLPTDTVSMSQLIIGQMLNGVIVGSLYGIIALGVTLTFGLTGIVNFALGAFMMLGAYTTWYFYDVLGWPYALAVLGAVGAV